MKNNKIALLLITLTLGSKLFGADRRRQRKSRRSRSKNNGKSPLFVPNITRSPHRPPRSKYYRPQPSPTGSFAKGSTNTVELAQVTVHGARTRSDSEERMIAALEQQAKHAATIAAAANVSSASHAGMYDQLRLQNNALRSQLELQTARTKLLEEAEARRKTKEAIEFARKAAETKKRNSCCGRTKRCLYFTTRVAGLAGGIVGGAAEAYARLKEYGIL